MPAFTLWNFAMGVAELATNKRAREDYMAGHEKRMKRWEAKIKEIEEDNQAFLELEENRVLDCAKCGNNVTGGVCPVHPSANVACSTCHQELPVPRADGRAAYDQVLAHCTAEHHWKWTLAMFMKVAALDDSDDSSDDSVDWD
jgi:ribosomal protein S27E